MPTHFGPRSPQMTEPRRAGIWMMMALLCFGMLHVIGGAMLLYNPASSLADRSSTIPDVGD